MRRVGFATGYDSALTVKEMTAFVRQAEQLGFELAFFSETVELIRDSVSALAAFAVGTERISLGCTQVVRLRNPLIMAQTFATLDELSGGRIVAALGACTAGHAQRYGLEPDEPARTLEEWVKAVRLLWTGEEVTFKGQSLSFSNAAIQVIPKRRSIPIWLASTSPTGLRLAARIGDGVMFGPGTSAEYTRNAIRVMREAMAKARRSDTSAFTFAQIINCSIAPDRRQAIEAVRWEIASKFAPRQLDSGVRARLRVGEPAVKVEDIPMFIEAYERGGKPALAAALPDSYVLGLTATGTANEVRDRVDEYVEAGLTLPVLRPASREQIPLLLEAFRA